MPHPDDCDHPKLQHLLDFDHLGDAPVECPDCHAMMSVEYEETYSEEEGEDGWFWLQRVTP